MKSENDNSNVKSLQVIKEPDFNVLQLDINGNLDKSLEVLTKLVQSKALKDKVVSVENALGLYVKTKELGLPFMAGVDHIIEINGKYALDVHAMRALVLKAGIIHWELVHDNVPLYKYIDSTKTVVARGVDDSCLPYGYEVPKGSNVQAMTEDTVRIKSIGFQPVFKVVDKIVYGANGEFLINYVTKYKFTRTIGKKEQVEYGEFSNFDAIVAGLHLKKDNTINEKSPWLIYNQNQREHRAWTFGVRKIADDILFGLMETSELYDLNKKDYTIEDGNAVLIEEEISSDN